MHAGDGETSNHTSQDPEKRMKRLHVHVSVNDIDHSIRFYRELFGSEPAVVKPDYAKWMLDDPRVNFAISKRGSAPGIRHLGIQVESRPELTEVYKRLQRAEGPIREDGATTCCYAQSEKSWIADPQGIQWETFLTTGESTVYGGGDQTAAVAPSACCEPPGLTSEPTAKCCA